MITFAIPTWNRVDKLKVCLESMLKQIHEIEDKVLIRVYNNASDDGTDELLEEFKNSHPTIIDYRNGIDHVQGTESFKRAFLLPETKYTWMFGDDDILAPNGLKNVIDYLKRKEVDFIHVAEATRVKNEQRIYQATTLELCSGFGFTEMTGFISGNICNTKKLQEVLNSPYCIVYQKAAFFQSLVIMDAFSDSPAAFFNAPVIDLQERQQTIETCERWNKEDVLLKYADMAEGLEVLRNKKRLPDKLPDDFFRYLEGNMFAKIMFNLYDSYSNKIEYVDNRYWEYLYSMASFLNEPQKMVDVITKFKFELDEYIKVKKAADEQLKKVQEAHDPSISIVYPFSYV